jgi:hypothetical protein
MNSWLRCDKKRKGFGLTTHNAFILIKLSMQKNLLKIPNYEKNRPQFVK